MKGMSLRMYGTKCRKNHIVGRRYSSSRHQCVLDGSELMLRMDTFVALSLGESDRLMSMVSVVSPSPLALFSSTL